LEKQTEKESDMPKKAKRKKRSAYTILVAISFILAFYIYWTTDDLFLAMVLILLGVGIAVVNK
jgi:Flp pilus assembly protein TadB